jgi:hypothetical protein
VLDNAFLLIEGHPLVEMSSEDECQSGIIRLGCAVKRNGKDRDKPGPPNLVR